MSNNVHPRRYCAPLAAFVAFVSVAVGVGPLLPPRGAREGVLDFPVVPDILESSENIENRRLKGASSCENGSADMKH